MKQSILAIICCVFLISSQHSNATHILGGEMSYVCLGNDDYLITLKVFRDCYGGAVELIDPVYFAIFKKSGNIFLADTISLLTTDTVDFLVDSCVNIPYYMCMEMGIYEYVAHIPPLNGGYTITFQQCCRSIMLSNLDSPLSTGSTYAANIPGSGLATCNSTPQANNYLTPYICVLNPVSIDASATDPDGDSIVYELCAPFHGASESVPIPTSQTPPPYDTVHFLAPYTSSYPVASSPPLQINPVTGEITGTPIYLGTYTVGVCAKEFRNGNLLGEFRRDFIITVADCSLSGSIASSIASCEPLVYFGNLNNSNYDFYWDFGDPATASDTSSAFEPSYNYPGPGDYMASLITTWPGCKDTSFEEVHVVDVDAAFSFSNAIPTYPTEFLDQSQSSYGSLVFWKWHFGDGDSSSLQNPTHTFLQEGLYPVNLKIWTSDNCMDSTTEDIAIFHTSASAPGNAPEFVTYPNPAADNLYIQLQSQKHYSIIRLELLDISGKKVLSKNITPQDVTELSITGLRGGCYWLTVFSEDGFSSTQMFMKE